MVQPLDLRPETPSQTAGPYVHIGCLPNGQGIAVWPADLGAEPFPGDGDVTIAGRILDGAGAPVTDALVEFWQADGSGRYHAGRRGFARRATDPETGEWSLTTVRPGRVPAPGGGMQAPHISIWIVARGINVGLATRLYFADAPDDPVLVRAGPRRRTLIATDDGAGCWRFDIRLQGEGETVFLDI